MTVLDAALDYVQHGFSVIPIRPKDKKPAIPEWSEYQKRIATEAELRMWFTNPNNNIAIVCGKVSGNLIVVDFDSMETAPAVLGSLDSVKSKTRVVKTAKGIHVYYYADDPASKKFENLHIDLQGNGKYVLAPPSIHPSGVAYTFESDLPPRKINSQMVEGLQATDTLYPVAQVISPFWEAGDRHSLALQLGGYFHKRTSFTVEQACSVIEIVMHIKGDTEESADRRRAVKDAYDKDYSFKLEAALVEGLDKVTPHTNNGELFIAGPLDIARLITKERSFYTLRELDTDRETIYYFDDIYRRAEELIKERAHTLFIEEWEKTLRSAEGSLEYAGGDEKDFLKGIISRLKKKLHDGPSVSVINEVAGNIRRGSFINVEMMNPPSHIPMLDGLLNTTTWEVEPFTPDLFYTWQVQAKSTYLNERITHRDVPLFNRYLQDVFYPEDIPGVLEYCGYSLHPGFPVQKTLWIVGKERIGKGVLSRILKGLLGEGYGVFELSRLLIGERFQYSGMMGINLAVDNEFKRRFRKGSAPDWKYFNQVVGGDTVMFEGKGREAIRWDPKLKMLLVGNLPLFFMDNNAAIERMILKQTKSRRETPNIPDLDILILKEERDKIFALLITYLKILQREDWRFIGEYNGRVTMQLWESLSDILQQFIDDHVSHTQGKRVTREAAYVALCEFCDELGTTHPSMNAFVRRMGQEGFPIHKGGTRQNRIKEFLDTEVDGAETDETVDHDILEEYENNVDTGKTLAGRAISHSRSPCLPRVHIGYMLPCMEIENKEKEKKHVKGNVPHADTEKNNSQNAVVLAQADISPVSTFKTMYRISLPSGMKEAFKIQSKVGLQTYHDQDVVTDIPSDILLTLIERGIVSPFKVDTKGSELN